MATGDLIALGLRVYSAGREILQAGRPRYPRHAVLLSSRLRYAMWNETVSYDATAGGSGGATTGSGGTLSGICSLLSTSKTCEMSPR